MIRNFQSTLPTVAEDCWVDPTAVVIGDVVLEEGVSVWPNAVLRGDVQQIRAGRLTNLQDGVVVHVNQPSTAHPQGMPCRIGEEVTVGHRAILHACTVGNRVLVGMGAIVMDDVVVEDEVIIAAGSVVSPGKVLESGHLYVGAPARKIRPLSDEEREHLPESARFYRELAQDHRTSG